MTINELYSLLWDKVQEKQLTGKNYIDRLIEEIKEVASQNQHEYFLDLYGRNVKYPVNENNLLIPYLLGIVNDFDINNPPVYVYGDFPTYNLKVL
jgi:hypothetical protein